MECSLNPLAVQTKWNGTDDERANGMNELTARTWECVSGFFCFCFMRFNFSFYFFVRESAEEKVSEKNSLEQVLGSGCNISLQST